MRARGAASGTPRAARRVGVVGMVGATVAAATLVVAGLVSQLPRGGALAIGETYWVDSWEVVTLGRRDVDDETGHHRYGGGACALEGGATVRILAQDPAWGILARVAGDVAGDGGEGLSGQRCRLGDYLFLTDRRPNRRWPTLAAHEAALAADATREAARQRALSDAIDRAAR